MYYLPVEIENYMGEALKKIGHRWSPGQSGNPSGRPKGAKTWSGLLAEMADKRDRNGRTRKDKILDKLLERAEQGHSWAVAMVLERMEGKAIQRSQTDITSNGESLNAQISFVKTDKIIDAAPSNSGELGVGTESPEENTNN